MILYFVCKESVKRVVNKESVRKMNIQGNINKLIMAIKQKGKEIRIETRMFYFNEASKYLTRITLSEKQTEDDKTIWVELYSGFSKVKLLKCLAEYYKKIEGEANG